MYDPLKHMTALPCFADLDLKIYLDDYTLQASSSTESQMVKKLGQGCRALQSVIEDDLGCTISESKADVVASSSSLLQKLILRLGRFGKAAAGKQGQAKYVARGLGITAAAGRTRKAFGKRSMTARRLQTNEDESEQSNEAHQPSCQIQVVCCRSSPWWSVWV